MGIRATYLYKGVVCPQLYLKIVSVVGWQGIYTGQVWAWATRVDSLANPLTPAFTLTETVPYVQGGDPYVMLYLQLKLDAALSLITDVLNDP